jgi:hypothetical protein
MFAFALAEEKMRRVRWAIFLGVSYSIQACTVTAARETATACVNTTAKCPVGADLNIETHFSGGLDVGGGFRSVPTPSGNVAYKDYAAGACKYQCTYVACPHSSMPRITVDLFECVSTSERAVP